MKLFNAMYQLVFLAIFLTTQCFAGAVRDVVVDAAVTAIPAAYDYTDSGSLIMTGTRGSDHIVVINETAGRIALNVDAPDKSVNPAATGNNIYLPAGGAIAMDDISIGNRIYLRSDTGAPIALAEVLVFVW